MVYSHKDHFEQGKSIAYPYLGFCVIHASRVKVVWTKSGLSVWVEHNFISLKTKQTGTKRIEWFCVGFGIELFAKLFCGAIDKTYGKSINMETWKLMSICPICAFQVCSLMKWRTSVIHIFRIIVGMKMATKSRNQNAFMDVDSRVFLSWRQNTANH